MWKKIFLTIPVVVIFVVLGGALRVDASIDANGLLDGRGWLWGGSDTPNTPATFGWSGASNASSGGTVTYGMKFPTGDGNVTGYAWNENYGWISFNGPDLSGCAPVLEQAKVVGSALSGGARILSVRDGGTNAGGWSGCISLSGAGYGVTINPDGSTLSGYGWNGENIMSNGVVEGLGWIDFSNARISGILKICPSNLTMSQGASHVLKLYYDRSKNCLELPSNIQPVSATSWSVNNTVVSLDALSGKTTTVSAAITKNSNDDTSTVTAKYIPYPGDAEETATAEVIVMGDRNFCPCDSATAANICSTDTFQSSQAGCNVRECHGTKYCGGKWNEIAPKH